MAKNSSIKIAISFFISLALIYWLISNIEWTTVWQELKTAELWHLLPLTISIFIQFLLRALRFKLLLLDSSSVKYRLSFDGIMLGNFINYIMPLRAGEFARPWFISQQTNNSFTSLFSVAVLERLFDLSAVLIIFFLSVYNLENLPLWIVSSANFLAVLALVILIFIFLTVVAKKILKKICAYLIGFTSGQINQKLSDITGDVIEASQVITSFTKLVAIVVSTALIWIVTIWGYYIIFQMFIAEPTFYQAAVVTAIIALAVAAPSAPGFIGVIQVGCVAAFLLLGINKELAVAYSLVAHLHMYLITIAYGIYLIFHYGLDLVKVKRNNKPLA